MCSHSPNQNPLVNSVTINQGLWALIQANSSWLQDLWNEGAYLVEPNHTPSVDWTPCVRYNHHQVGRYLSSANDPATSVDFKKEEECFGYQILNQFCWLVDKLEQTLILSSGLCLEQLILTIDSACSEWSKTKKFPVVLVAQGFKWSCCPPLLDVQALVDAAIEHRINFSESSEVPKVLSSQ